jgi:hypothetical protein
VTTTAPPLTPRQRQAVEALARPFTDLRERRGRHNGYRALVGGLLRGGLPRQTVEALVEALCEATGDEQAGKRLALVEDTEARLAAGGTAEGWPSLTKLLNDDDALRKVQKLLGIDDRNVVATYDYCDEAGRVLFQTVRFDPKDFRQRRPGGKGGWIWNIKGVERLLYRLPGLVASDPAQPVYVPEGEKDVDALRALGLVATCNPMGAGKWQDHFAGPLRGRHVVVIPDNDDPGRQHARQVAASVAAVAASVKLLELPDLPAGGDVSDWLTAGGTVEELRRLAEAAPEARTKQEPPIFPDAPRPLSATLLRVPPLDPAMIPAPLRAWLVDIAQRGCFPLEFPTTAAIEALAALVGRKLGIRPKRHDDWLVVPNLWGAIVGPPSIQKTPGAEEAMLPLKRLVAEALAAHEAALEAFEVRSLVAKAQAKAAKDALEKAAKAKRPKPGKSGQGATDPRPDDAPDLEQLARQALGAETEKAPALKRYVVNDATVEKLGEILAENSNGVLTFRDELTGFLRTLDREGHENDRGF